MTNKRRIQKLYNKLGKLYHEYLSMTKAWSRIPVSQIDETKISIEQNDFRVKVEKLVQLIDHLEKIRREKNAC